MSVECSFSGCLYTYFKYLGFKKGYNKKVKISRSLHHIKYSDIHTIFTIIPVEICGFYLAIYLSMSPKCRKAEYLEKFAKRDSN